MEDKQYKKLIDKFDNTIIILSKKYTKSISPLDWEDLAQELRMLLWQKRHIFDSSKSQFSTWANTLCKNKLKDFIRYYKRQKRDQNKKVSYDEMEEEGLQVADINPKNYPNR